MLVPLIAACCLSCAPPSGDGEAGGTDYFLGTLSVFGTEMRLLVEVPADGPGVLVSPDQSPEPVPLSSAAVSPETLEWAVEAIGASFAGAAVDGEPGVYDGVFTQGALPLKLTMRRVTKAEAGAARTPPRPQTPVPPFAYRVEDVTLPGGAGGVTLAGTLTLPDPGEFGPGPYAAAVLVSGSGPQDRDEALFGHRPFAVLADALTTAGVAVLRCDDRGVGDSTGDHAAATTANFTADARAAVRFLRDRDDVRAVGIVGHSEGGLIAPRAAVAAPGGVAFCVLLAGPALPGAAVLRTQAAAVVRASGGDDAAVAANRAVQDALLNAASAPAGERDALFAAAVDEAVAAMPAAGRDAGRAALAAQAKQVDTPWMRAFLTDDPAPTLRALRTPVLACFGGRDVQVTAADHAPAMTAALADHPAAAVVVFPRLNHLFQPAETGLPTEYARIETTFDPTALGLIVDWVVRTTAE